MVKVVCALSVAGKLRRLKHEDRQRNIRMFRADRAPLRSFANLASMVIRHLPEIGVQTAQDASSRQNNQQCAEAESAWSLGA